MAGSDVRSVHITGDSDGASATSVAGAATVTATGGFTLTSTGGVSFTAGRNITATTAGASDGGKIVTVVGTGINGNALSEEITLASSATTVSGSEYFRTVTAATIDTTSTGNVSLGNGAAAADVIFQERARLKGAFIVNSGTAGVISFVNGSPVGTVKMKLGTVSSASAERDVTIPGEGVMFEDGAYVTYTGAIFSNMTLFHA
jgi:hypothetical protein